MPKVVSFQLVSEFDGTEDLFLFGLVGIGFLFGLVARIPLVETAIHGLNLDILCAWNSMISHSKVVHAKLAHVFGLQRTRLLSTGYTHRWY